MGSISREDLMFYLERKQNELNLQISVTDEIMGELREKTDDEMKMVPKKMIVDAYDSGTYSYCPTCKRLLCFGIYEFPHCHYCGQALDREGTE